MIGAYFYKKGKKLKGLHKRFCLIYDNHFYVFKKVNSRFVSKFLNHENSNDKDESFKFINMNRERITQKIEIKQNSTINSSNHGNNYSLQIISDEESIILTTKDVNTRNHFFNKIQNIIVSKTKLIMDCFDIKGVLGRGYYGKVFLCNRKNTKSYIAIKAIKKNFIIQNDAVHSTINEKNILMKCSNKNPFIINFHCAFQSDSKVYIGMEYASGGNLSYYMRKTSKSEIPLNDIKLYLAEVAIGLNFLHKNNIIYRDLKAENILICSDGHIKLADFGLAKELKDGEKVLTFCGTPDYIAPEIIKRIPYSYSVDWWMFGILAYELIFKYKPFNNPNNVKLFENICKSDVIFPSTATETTVSFISSLLQKEPDKRPNYDAIISHPFFNGINFNDVYEKKIHPTFIPQSNPVCFDEEFQIECKADSFASSVDISDDIFQNFSCINQEQNDIF